MNMLLIAALTVSMLPGPSASPRRPEVWFSHAHPEPLGREPDQWPTVQRELDVLQFPINAVAFLIPQDDLKRLRAVLKRNGIRVSIECGYFDWEPQQSDFSAPNPKRITDRPRPVLRPGIGAETARIEIAKLAPLFAAGMRPDYIVMDGPVRRLIHPGADTGRIEPHGSQEGLADVEAAVDEVVAYMREWRRRLPNVRFMALTNFPNWGWKGQVAYWASGPGGMYWGDYYPVLEALVRKTRAAGMPLAGLVMDNPYEYMMGRIPVGPPWPEPTKRPQETDWLARVLDLERTARGLGLAVSLIVNSQKGGHESDLAFVRYTLECLEAYRSRGGMAERYVFQTWYPHPEKLIPDTDPHSMTGMLRQALDVIKGR
jgi:hypothetical protein